MARQQFARSVLVATPLFPRETLYVGVDIGEAKNVSGFLSPTLLQRHGRFEGCPTLTFEQSREGFRSFVDRLQQYVPLEQASELKAYFGWAPKRDQSGSSFDRTALSKRGVRSMKQTLFLMAMRAVTIEGEWANIYHRLLPHLATYDERTKEYRGKMKAIGRIAGQMTSMIFALLKTDQELLSHVPLGQEPPSPMLYDPAVHRRHREGHYCSLKPGTRPRTILQLPKQQ